MVIKNGKYAYVTTYHLIWDKNAKQPLREPGKNKTVGKIIGGENIGIIKWNSSFLEEHPELENFVTKRVLKRKNVIKIFMIMNLNQSM